MTTRPSLHLLRLRGRLSIFDQLCLEEALLRCDGRNWLLTNFGVDPGVAVLGASGKPSKLLHEQAMVRDGLSAVKRFSGGGTVFVDSGTLFTTLLMNKDAVDVPPWPREVMDWTGEVYGGALGRCSLEKASLPPALRDAVTRGGGGGGGSEGGSNFALRENDYTLDGRRKFAGNAQSIARDRWLHHTSWLWDFDDAKMAAYLQLPEKAPDYRARRSHQDFLCRMNEFVVSPDAFFAAVEDELADRFTVVEASLEEAQEALQLEHRKSNKWVELDGSSS